MSQVRWWAEARPTWGMVNVFGVQVGQIDPTQPYRLACLIRRGPGEPAPQFDPMVALAIPLPEPEGLEGDALAAWEANGPTEPAIGSAWVNGAWEAPEPAPEVDAEEP